MISNPWEIYDGLIDEACRAAAESVVARVQLGSVWTLLESEQGGCGLAMTPTHGERTLAWPGTLQGRPLAALIPWVKSWNAYEACIGMAALNAALGAGAGWHQELHGAGEKILSQQSANLALFAHFKSKLVGKRVVVIGRYPGLEELDPQGQWQVIERNPGQGDYPDSACEYLLPEADWVFITASSLVNKTLPRLLALSQQAVTVLMGPTTPWSPQWAAWGVDFLAGVVLKDAAALDCTVAEGGGTAIFGSGVDYFLRDLGGPKLSKLKGQIATTYRAREELKQRMEQWYGGPESASTPFPQRLELERVDRQLSQLDSCYNRQWAARNSTPHEPR
uniref:Heavy-metal chelation domain-containing protein n=1 Tax=Magnetococcus massalia (strain MO-1) TaxID=451514 RepID=A0A1S7LEV4_MAGMO|nr:conserved protein of unknown function [Candidatus Magnetococcus massalia]